MGLLGFFKRHDYSAEGYEVGQFYRNEHLANLDEPETLARAQRNAEHINSEMGYSSEQNAEWQNGFVLGYYSSFETDEPEEETEQSKSGFWGWLLGR